MRVPAGLRQVRLTGARNVPAGKRHAPVDAAGEGIVLEVADGKDGPVALVGLHNESNQTIIGVELTVNCYDGLGFAIFDRGKKDFGLTVEDIEFAPSCSATSMPAGPLPENTVSVTIVGARLRTSDAVLHEVSELFDTSTQSEPPRAPRTHGSPDDADHVSHHAPIESDPERGTTAEARPRTSRAPSINLLEIDMSNFTTPLLFAILVLALVFVAARNMSSLGEMLTSAEGGSGSAVKERAEGSSEQSDIQGETEAEDGRDETSTDDDPHSEGSATLPGDAAQDLETINFGDLTCRLPGGYDESQGDDPNYDKRFYVYDRGEDEWRVILTSYTQSWSPTTYEELLEHYRAVRGDLYEERAATCATMR